MGRGQNDSPGSAASKCYDGSMSEAIKALNNAFLRVGAGRPTQGVFLVEGPTSHSLQPVLPFLESSKLQTKAQRCTKRTSVQDLIGWIKELPKTDDVELEDYDPQRMVFPKNTPSCLFLYSADTMPDETLRFMLQVMKGCNASETPLLIVTTGHDKNNFLGRLGSIDGDSFMMWHTEKL